MNKNIPTIISTQYSRLWKIIKEFQGNGSCAQYCQSISQYIIFRNGMHFIRIFIEPHRWYTLHVKFTQDIYCNKTWYNMTEQNLWKVCINTRTNQC